MWGSNKRYASMIFNNLISADYASRRQHENAGRSSPASEWTKAHSAPPPVVAPNKVLPTRHFSDGSAPGHKPNIPPHSVTERGDIVDTIRHPGDMCVTCHAYIPNPENTCSLIRLDRRDRNSASAKLGHPFVHVCPRARGDDWGDRWYIICIALQLRVMS
ncbi:hypothetical protein DL93DRAFT_1147866 [Clavulina sp. PMI_390]|nr:hypothetical protein DL93DRAFT_1147866 [Clavulina sp. PMI_390]